MHKYAGILNAFSRKHVLVIGDLILDQYIKGSVSRISPEAPVPVVLQEQLFHTPGGAANVANNLSSLGAKVTLVGRVGDDKEGDLLKKVLAERQIRTEGVLTDKRVETILKTRIIAHRQQVVRIDRETVSDDPDNLFYRKTVAPFIKRNFHHFDAIIISDYGKGVVQAALVADITAMCRQKHIPVIVDPKVEHLKFYGPVTSITPNRTETENALKSLEPDTRRGLGIGSTKLNSMKVIIEAGEGLLKYLGIESLLVTLGEDGMCLFEAGKPHHHIPTKAREVFDVSGAGDTVISVFALAIASGATKRQAADIANHAAGVVVAKIGAAAVLPEELVRSLKEDK